MTAIDGEAVGAAEISMSIWGVEATGLSFTACGFDEGSGNKSDDIDTAEVFKLFKLCTETGPSLPIVLIAVEMVTAIDNVPGSWALRSSFICASSMGGAAEWSIIMLSSVIKEGITEGSTDDKGAPPISEVVEWSAIAPILAFVAKEGITEGSTNKGGTAGWSAKGKVTSSIGTTPAM